ncbi:hypothetical protein K7G98_20440 [Saccharothrix sp. MB29]|nr:hypothetical protein [Saccharothrix sp. MB29]
MVDPALTVKVSNTAGSYSAVPTFSQNDSVVPVQPAGTVTVWLSVSV